MKHSSLALTCATLALATAISLQAQQSDIKVMDKIEDIVLPAPRMEGGKPLMTALKDRQTKRSYDSRALPQQVMSDLLWAACGVNRAESGKRTAPTARNWQEIDVYAVTTQGVYRYDAKDHVLRGVAKGDLRGSTGMQDFVSTAPLNLVYVADVSKMKGVTPADVNLYIGADTGFVSQNVYLFCASEGLSTVVRGMVNRDAMSKALGLPEQCRIVLAQTVGYPAEK